MKGVAIEQAIREVINEDEDGGHVSIHELGCTTSGEVECTCRPVVLLVPPADSAAVWLWLHQLDSNARNEFRGSRS